MAAIVSNLQQVRQRMMAAAERGQRDVADITLVAVSKYSSVSDMRIAFEAGVQHFGESRVEEAAAKIPALLAEIGTDAARRPTFHMIGHLQRRKVTSALSWAHLIHSVDSIKLGQRINRLAQRDANEPVSILLEVNISGEASKAGFAWQNWETRAEVRKQVEETVAVFGTLAQVNVQGLMTMAPHASDPEDVRSVFRSLRQLRDWCLEQNPELDWPHLSMGMTNDFGIAIEEGATIVRVGRAIFKSGSL